jgi:hypothetical protein
LKKIILARAIDLRSGDQVALQKTVEREVDSIVHDLFKALAGCPASAVAFLGLRFSEIGWTAPGRIQQVWRHVTLSFLQPFS